LGRRKNQKLGINKAQIKAIKNIFETTGAKLTEAVRMATVNPAKVIKLDSGIIASGKPADFVVLDKELNVEMTIMNGEIRYISDKLIPNA